MAVATCSARAPREPSHDVEPPATRRRLHRERGSTHIERRPPSIAPRKRRQPRRRCTDANIRRRRRRKRPRGAMSARGRFRVERRRHTHDSRGGPRPRAPRSVRVRLRVFESAARSIGARRRRPPPRRGRSVRPRRPRARRRRRAGMCRGSRVEIVPRGVFSGRGGAPCSRTSTRPPRTARVRVGSNGSGGRGRVGVVCARAQGGVDGATSAMDSTKRGGRAGGCFRAPARARGTSARAGGSGAAAASRTLGSAARTRARHDLLARAKTRTQEFVRQHVTLEDGLGGQRRQRVDCRRRVGIRHRIGARPRASRGASRCGGKRAFARERHVS